MVSSHSFFKALSAAHVAEYPAEQTVVQRCPQMYIYIQNTGLYIKSEFQINISAPTGTRTVKLWVVQLNKELKLAVKLRRKQHNELILLCGFITKSIAFTLSFDALFSFNVSITAALRKMPKLLRGRANMCKNCQ